jgi:hypothetical protein
VSLSLSLSLYTHTHTHTHIYTHTHTHTEDTIPYEDNSGANANVYYVCNYLGGPMTQLPFVTPDQIKAARLLKKLLTGRLDSLVSTYPLFPGTEANFLRAQVMGTGVYVCLCAYVCVS